MKLRGDVGINTLVGRRIEEAVSLETSIEIIPEWMCEAGMGVIRYDIYKKFPDLQRASIVPVMFGGGVVGKNLSEHHGVNLNPMQMSYYPGESGNRLEEPICLKLPDVDKIVVDGAVLPVVLIEGIVDTQETLKKAINVISDQVRAETGGPVPDFHIYAMVSKVRGKSDLPHFRAPFRVDPRIWVRGWGTDDGGVGRELTNIVGRLDPRLEDGEVPRPPYFVPTQLYHDVYNGKV